MSLGTEVSVRKFESRPPYRWLATYRDGDKLRKKYFKRKAEAEAFKKKKELESAEHGVGSPISASERAAVVEARATIETLGLGLREVIAIGIDRAKLLNDSGTVGELRDLLLLAKRNKSENHLRGLRSRLGRFVRDFGEDRRADSIEPVELDSWLDGLGIADQTGIHYRTALVMMFGHGMKKEKCKSNPAKNSERPESPKSNPEILTPARTEKLIKACGSEILPTVLIQLFAGLRTSEMERLKWRDIDLAGGLIYVNEDSKTGERFVKIRPNLGKWLRPYAIKIDQRLDEKVLPLGSRRLLDEARTAAGFKWIQNYPRHSYASYLLVASEDAPATALQLGQHGDTSTLFRHYRRLVTPDAAKAFWAIVPKRGRKIVKVA